MPAFFSPYRHGFVRVGACVPQVAVAEPAKNGDQVLALLAQGDKAGLALMVFPELCLSAYAIDDLLFQDAVLDAVVGQIARLLTASKKLSPVFVVGASPSIAAGCSALCRRCFCRITASSTSGGISPRAKACAARR